MPLFDADVIGSCTESSYLKEHTPMKVGARLQNNENTHLFHAYRKKVFALNHGICLRDTKTSTYQAR